MRQHTLELAIALPIRPRGQGRPRFDPRSGRAYTPPTTRNYVAVIREAAMKEWGGRDPLAGPLYVKVSAIFSLPKRAKAREFHTQKPDLDNIVKAALDALAPHKVKRAIVWPGVFADDTQIVTLNARKEWSATEDQLAVEVWSIE